MTQNVVIAYGNRADEANVSGGYAVPTLPLANLKNRKLHKVWRSYDRALSSTQFNVTFDRQAAFRVLGLIAHNFSLDAAVRIRAGNDPSFATNLYDSGWAQVWPAVYPSSTLLWEDENWWSGQYTQRQIDSYNKHDLIHDLGEVYRCQYFKVEIDDVGNPDGYVEAGRLFIAGAWQPAFNMETGARLGWEDPSGVQVALSGAESYDRRAKFRRMAFNTPFMTDDEAMTQAFELMGTEGVTGEVIVIWNPDDTVHAIRRMLYGRMDELNAIEFPYPIDGATAAWMFREITK